MDGWTDGRTDGRTDGQTDKQTFLKRCVDASKNDVRSSAFVVDFFFLGHIVSWTFRHWTKKVGHFHCHHVVAVCPPLARRSFALAIPWPFP